MGIGIGDWGSGIGDQVVFFGSLIPNPHSKLKYVARQILVLGNVREHCQEERLEFQDEKTLLTAMLRGGPVALAVKRFTPAVMAEVENEFLASVRDYRAADGRYLIPGEFITVCGSR